MQKYQCSEIEDLVCKHAANPEMICPKCPKFILVEVTEDKNITGEIERADRYNSGKPKWSLVHFESLLPLVQVLEYGAVKYAPRNWMKPMPPEEILESMQRHLAKLFDGEQYDEESKLLHIGHIMCNAMFYTYQKQQERLCQKTKF